jgi:hypothetical protein
MYTAERVFLGLSEFVDTHQPSVVTNDSTELYWRKRGWWRELQLGAPG